MPSDEQREIKVQRSLTWAYEAVLAGEYDRALVLCSLAGHTLETMVEPKACASLLDVLDPRD